MAQITPEIIDSVLNELSTTEISLNKIAQKYNIPESSLRYKILSSDEYAAKYARAKSLQSELYIESLNERTEELIQKIKDCKYDSKTVSALVQAYKIDCENKRWYGSKVVPKFGDKLNISGTVGLKPEPPDDLEKLTIEEAKQLIYLKEKAQGKVIEAESEVVEEPINKPRFTEDKKESVDNHNSDSG